MTTTSRSPTRLLDLPIEVRQIIYTELLPSDRAVHYPPSHSRNARDRTALAVRAAHPVLHEEMEDWMYKHCTVVLTIVPDVPLGLPEGIEWARFQAIKIQLDYMSRHCNLHDELVGLKQALISLLHGQPQRFPDLVVYFREDENPYRGAPGCHHEDNTYALTDWYEEMPAKPRGTWEDPWDDMSWLNSDDEGSDTDQDDNDPMSGKRDAVITCMKTSGFCREPMPVTVLEHFLQLPPCRSATVLPLEKLGCDNYPDIGHMRPRCFDADYNLVIDCALELWLEGKRDGISLPQERDQYGRPVLEAASAFASRWKRGVLRSALVLQKTLSTNNENSSPGSRHDSCRHEMKSVYLT